MEELRDEGAPDGTGSLRARRVAVAAAAAALALGLAALAWLYLPGICAWVTNADEVRAFVGDRPVLSRLVLVGAYVLQVVLAFLPGEPLELASGYAFGFWEGTALCLVASAVATSVIFWVVRRWGRRAAAFVLGGSSLERFGWITNARHLELLMLVVFLIPGTPKDLLTYLAGLTRMRFAPVLAIATLGRIPSVVTSTMAASALGDGDYVCAVLAALAGVVLAVAGGLLWRRLEGRPRP